MNDSTNIDLAAEVAANPSEEAPVTLTKAEKAARRKADNEAKKVQAAKDKKAAAKVKSKEDAAKKKDAADAKALTAANKTATTYVNEGLKAIQLGQKSLIQWSVAAYNLKQLCDDVKGLSYGAMALEHWGIAANTASKLAVAGGMCADLIADEGEKGNWLPHLPQNNLNTLSMIARLKDEQVDAGIDQEIIHPKATEKAITDFAATFDTNSVVATQPREIPGTPAADAEAAAALSESDKPETPAQFVARVTKGADDMKLSPALRIKLAVALVGDLTGKRVDDLFAAMEKAHPAPESDSE